MVKITGTIMSNNAFRFIESNKFNVTNLLAVLQKK